MNCIVNYSSQDLAIKQSNPNFKITKEIIFIDSQVEDYQFLAEGVIPDIQTIILKKDRDGIRTNN